MDHPAAPTTAPDKGLRAGAIGPLASTAIGLASAAPAYSLAATLGTVAAAVGDRTPVVMVLGFVPMFLIAYGYKELNAAEPDCGTTFTWATRAFGPRTGWLGGWGIIAADVIVMANLAQIAGAYGFRLVGARRLAADTTWVTAAGVVWIVVMTVVCYVGVEVSARLQAVLLTVEVAILLVLGGAALARVYGGSAPPGSAPVSWTWFDPTRTGSVSAFTKGVLISVFIYWGWDTCLSVNEETTDSGRVPGRAAVTATVLLLAVYATVTTAAQSFAGTGTHGIGLADPANSADVLSNLGHEVFGTGRAGRVLDKLLILMVLTSAAASTLTTILPTARTTLSMAAHRALPARFARVHPRFATPTWSTVCMGVASVAFYVALTKASANVLADTISSIGLVIAFTYALTGFACVRYHRTVLTRSPRDLWLKGVLPGTGAVLLTYFFADACVVYAAPGYGTTTWRLPWWPHWDVGGVLVTGIGSLLLGVVLMAGCRLARPAFFRQETLGRRPAARRDR